MHNTILDPRPQWQLEIKNAVNNSDELLNMLDIDPQDVDISDAFTKNFPCLVPRSFVQRMQSKNCRDPLLLQVIPLSQENKTTPGFTTDPLEETQYVKVPGLIHKYFGRALLTLTGACAIHCRYCFRRHFNYQDNSFGPNQNEILNHLEQERSISEIILSGGDPLSINDQKLAQWIEQLSQIQHIKRLRIHTRLPVMIPTRITPQLCQTLAKSRFEVIMVLHINHPQELDESTLPAWQQLKKAGVLLLNQSVLLNNINNNANTLQNLSEKMLQYGIMPYYLHQLDPVQGAQHFHVPIEEARTIYQQWLTIAPGYMVPKWVTDTPHKPYKQPFSLNQ